LKTLKTLPTKQLLPAIDVHGDPNNCFHQVL